MPRGNVEPVRSRRAECWGTMLPDQYGELGLRVEWDLREAGPPQAEQTVLLLPGGVCRAGSHAELMARPELANTRF